MASASIASASALATPPFPPLHLLLRIPCAASSCTGVHLCMARLSRPCAHFACRVWLACISPCDAPISAVRHTPDDRGPPTILCGADATARGAAGCTNPLRFAGFGAASAVRCTGAPPISLRHVGRRRQCCERASVPVSHLLSALPTSLASAGPVSVPQRNNARSMHWEQWPLCASCIWSSRRLAHFPWPKHKRR
jgi:hypothetical protein